MDSLDVQIEILLGPEAAPFESLIEHLMSTGNESRGQAEQLFNACKQKHPDTLLLKLAHIIQYSSQPGLRSMAAVLLRKQIGLWSQISESSRRTIKEQVLACLQREETKSVLKKLCDTVAELAASILDEDEWPELLPYLFQCITSDVLRLKEVALLVLGQLAQYMGSQLQPHLIALHGIFQQTLSQTMPGDVCLAALRATASFVQSLESSQDRDLFQDLLPGMMQTLTRALEIREEVIAQEALEMLIEVAGTAPRFLRKQLPEVVSSMVQIAEAVGLEEGTRHLALEFLITLAEARERAPGMMRFQFPRYLINSSKESFERRSFAWDTDQSIMAEPEATECREGQPAEKEPAGGSQPIEEEPCLPVPKSLPTPFPQICHCGAPQSVPSRGAWMSPPPTNYRPLRAPALATAPNTQAVILAPVPQAQNVPVVSPPYSFQIPRTRISSPADIEKFHRSECGRAFLGFVVALSDSIRGHKLSDYCVESPVVKAMVEILEIMSRWADDIPPVQQPARYGNPAFRQWQERLQQGKDLMLKIVPQELCSAIVEIFPYFADSFGNATRIDYGTGHETNFAAWLFCLARLGIVREDDYQALVSRVFVTYLGLMRKLQTTYWLEPAGSHGVWGLDDYHFLPFIFGSSQLVDHKYMKPKSIHNDDILDNFSNEYLYLSCVAFVKKVKKGHLSEHSPMIDDISGVPNWKKVNSGMLKMYKAEVLEKVPIMQHFLFGSLIKW